VLWTGAPQRSLKHHSNWFLNKAWPRNKFITRKKGGLEIHPNPGKDQPSVRF
jgi:hypothetical protein